MIPNSTCEVCWCIVLDEHRGEHVKYHEAKERSTERGVMVTLMDDTKELEELRQLLEGLTEEKPYKTGEEIYLYCGKSNEQEKHSVFMNSTRTTAMCFYCGSWRKTLPTRYKTSKQEFTDAAVAYVKALLAK